MAKTNNKSKRNNKLKAIFYVKDKSGEWIDLATLPEEKRIEIATELNDRAMRAAGFVPVGENRREEQK